MTALLETEDDTRFTVPLYTVTEAARYLEVPPSTLNGWARVRQAAPGRA